MLQTDRKTDQSRQNAQDREQTARSRQDRETGSNAALALDAILAGGNWDQLPADGVLALSHSLGNDALLSLFTLQSVGPETGPPALPAGPCRTAAAEWNPAAPLLAEAPDFGGMSPLGPAAPMAV